MTTKFTVYELDDCTGCTNTKRHLDRKGLPYEVLRADDPVNAAAIAELKYKQAPVVVYGDDHWSGFRPDKINEIAKRLETEGK